MKRFILNSPLNRETNQIKIDKVGKEEFKSEKGKFFEKVARPEPKYSKSIMVSGGISYNGVGKLIFVTGMMTGFSYLQTLELFKEDIERLGANLIFQQDNAPCHVSKSCLNYINQNFDNKLEFWPANSPDLSPIEELWALVQEKLSKYNFETTEELTKKLQYIWNRIPKRLCKHLINSFDKKIQKIKNDGERANQRNHTKYKSIGEWNNRWNDTDNIERIVYNQKVLDNMKIKKIREIKKEIKDIESAFKEAKTRYSHDNKEIIKNESKELFQFFLTEEKNMKDEFQKRIFEKQKEIKKYKETAGKNLFNIFSNEEKINNISIKQKKLKKIGKAKLKKIGSTNFTSNNIE